MRNGNIRMDWGKIRELHSKGLTNAEIAKALGYRRDSVACVVHRSGLRPNSPDRQPWYEDKALELYRAGASDQEIAMAIGLLTDNVRTWRKRRGLPPNSTPGMRRNRRPPLDQKRALELFLQGKTDVEIAQELDAEPGTVRSWRSRKGLVTQSRKDLQASVDEIDMAMTDDEIRRSWRRAENHGAQVLVLAELNAVSPCIMERKLKALGIEVPEREKRRRTKLS